MGLFDFFKPKKNKELNNTLAKLNETFFPKGKKDMEAVTDAVLYILDYKIDKDEAQTIAVRSVAISRISENFSQERLKQHLSGYSLHHFNDSQIEKFHGYLSLLSIASMMFKKSPSEVVRQNDTWIIP